MFKSIFAKYFSVTAVLITLSFILLSVLQMLLARQYWLTQKEVMLAEHAQNISGYVAVNSFEVFPGEYFIPSSLTPTLERLAESFNGTALVTDTSFRVIMCSENRQCDHPDQTITDPTLRSQMKNAPFFAVSRVNNFFEQSQYCSGTPVIKDGTQIGYVLVTTSAQELFNYMWDNTQTFAISGIAILVIAFVVLYLITYNQARPLREMAAATRHFSQGDFSYRIRVRGKDEVAELAAALNGMAVSLSSLEDMRRSFVGNVSHELRTPMTTISGFIDGMLDGTIPPERQPEYLAIVSDETKRLSRLVQSMLDLSRIDSGQLKPNPISFDLTAATCSTLLLFEKRIEEKDLRIEGLDLCDPHFVTADYDLIQQVVYNLIDNAVKFTEQGGYIRFAIHRQDDRTYFTLRNSGDGIPSTEMPFIFERFYKSDRSRSLDKSGTGLGLYLTKTLINLHGGEISVASREQEYCEFSFYLPDTQKNA